MTSIPTAGYFIDGARTNLEAKTAQDEMLEVLREELGGNAIAELTISSGSVTATQGLHSIDTESDAGDDYLDNIIQTNLDAGHLLLIRAEDAGRTINVRHSQGGAGEIITAEASTIVLDDTNKWILLVRKGTQWLEVFKSYRAVKGADITSASPLVIGPVGNYFDVVGAVDFAVMTVAADRWFMLHFDSALTITHGGSLALPNGRDIETAAGTELTCMSIGVNSVRVLSVSPPVTQPVFFEESSDITLVETDHGRTLHITDTATVTLPDAAAAGPGWTIRVMKYSAGVERPATIVPAGADTIELWADPGLTSILLFTSGDYLDLISTGSGWVASGEVIVKMSVILNAETQVVANTTNTVVEFDAVGADTHSGWEGVQPYHYEIPFSGYYLLNTVVIVDEGSSPHGWDVSIRRVVSGPSTEWIALTRNLMPGTGDEDNLSLLSMWNWLAKGEEVLVMVRQDSGGNLNIQGSTVRQEQTQFEIVRLG
ncbi:hypothetical protein LCGC14_0231860 [marine sediment metagenome]|uniref:Uncharacterized protein n=1 Tax=marine sediment metagenome TaxID=412755 RepID=A0A0F9XE70_9ZZZZ